MALTSPSCPAHWVTDRSGECRLPLVAERDVCEESASKVWRVADDVSYRVSISTPHTNLQLKEDSSILRSFDPTAEITKIVTCQARSCPFLSNCAQGGIRLSFDPPIDPVCHLGLGWMDRENQETQETKRQPRPCPIDKMSKEKEKKAKVGKAVVDMANLCKKVKFILRNNITVTRLPKDSMGSFGNAVGMRKSFSRP